MQESKRIMQLCKDYLIEKENIVYCKEFIESLKFKKQEYYKQCEEEKVNKVMFEKKCKNCKYFEKRDIKASSIKVGYCWMNRKIQSQNGNICNHFKNL